MSAAVRRSRGGVTAEAITLAVRGTVLAALSDPAMSPVAVADSAAHAARHALAAIENEPVRIGTERQGWRGRLAYIELLLREGNHATALAEIRAMIDGDA